MVTTKRNKYRYILKQWYANGVYVGQTSSLSKNYIDNLASNQKSRGRKVKVYRRKV